jgi:hypothetical protein
MLPAIQPLACIVNRLDGGTSRWYKRVLGGFRKTLFLLMFAQRAPNPLLGTNASLAIYGSLGGAEGSFQPR